MYIKFWLAFVQIIFNYSFLILLGYQSIWNLFCISTIVLSFPSARYQIIKKALIKEYAEKSGNGESVPKSPVITLKTLSLLVHKWRKATVPLTLLDFSHCEEIFHPLLWEAKRQVKVKTVKRRKRDTWSEFNRLQISRHLFWSPNRNRELVPL